MIQYNNHSIKEFHTFHTDARTRLLTILANEKEAQQYLSKPAESTNRLVIGGGSNLLFTRDFEGELIQIDNKGFEIIEEKGLWVWVKVAAGENWNTLVQWAVEHGYGGIENLSYIPGTVGAAPVQNIGAYGVEFKEVFNSLEAIDLADGSKQNFYLQELDFDYRYSIFKGSLKNKFLISSVVVKLARYPKVTLDYGNLKEMAQSMSGKKIPDIVDVRNAVIAIRKTKLPNPDELGNAGSFFKNPIITHEHFDDMAELYHDIVSYPQKGGGVKLPAAWLIEKAGFKGFVSGQAGVHPKHALILINLGKAQGGEIYQLSQLIQQKVMEIFGIPLEPEVIIL
jgi:UDP-N-acetylmuramate dehydrogenase